MCLTDLVSVSAAVIAEEQQRNAVMRRRGNGLGQFDQAQDLVRGMELNRAFRRLDRGLCPKLGLAGR